MIKGFTLLLILFISLCASKTYLRGSAIRLEDSGFTNPSILSLSSINLGQVSLKRSNNGFFISAELPDSLNTNLTTNTADMILALYTDNTLLFNYNCSDYKSCHINSSTTVAASFPYFTAEGEYASVDASLSSGYWKLSSDAIVNTTEGNYSINSTTPYGIIGMGLDGNASANFINQPSFSISLTANGDSGQLLFTPDMSLAESDTPQAKLSAGSNWHIHGVNTIDIGFYINVKNTSLIFDLNSDTIGLPLTIYNQVLEALESQYGLVCSTDTYYKPVCSNYQMKDDFPGLKINIGDQSISIPSSVYVQGGDADIQTYAVSLSLKALSSNLTGESYVTPVYENYIILSYPVLAYYYTVFDGNSQTVTLYTADHSESMSYILYIVVGWFGLFIVIALCYYCYMRMKVARQANADRATENQSSIQDPLMAPSASAQEVNDQVPDQQQESFSQG